MSTKFVSKNSNLMVVLRSGIEGSRALGTASKPGLYARFQGGIIDVKNDEMADLLRSHPGFGTDFIEVAEEEVDPYEYNRKEIEPTHVISEMKYGHVEKLKGVPPKKIKLSPEIKSMIEKQALEMLPSLLKSNPGILKDMLQKLVAEESGKTATETVMEDVTAETPTPVKRGPGRPAVAK